MAVVCAAAGSSPSGDDPKRNLIRALEAAGPHAAYGHEAACFDGFVGTIVLKGQDPDGSLLRWSFNDLRPRSFTWRGEHSSDGGKTWSMKEEHRMTRPR